ncbi:MAG: hypothetical protein FJ197_02135 [Gammaproteobacteria bacterium]|nr:hypothetical protein [Gammaproteobacteria bacterium]
MSTANVRDKGSGKVDWERHSLKYIVYAINSAQKRQHKLWSAIVRTRRADGSIPVDWPAIEDYVESVRRTHSLMIDIETVGREHDAKHGPSGRPSAKKKARKKK